MKNLIQLGFAVLLSLNSLTANAQSKNIKDNSLLWEVSPSQHTIYYISYALLVVVSSYYLFGFYKFYKQTELYTGNTKNSLWKIYHELRLNMERYQSFGFLLLPHFLVTIGLAIYNMMEKHGKSLTELTFPQQLGLIITVLIGTLGVIISIVLWTKYIYGKSAKQLENILNEMDE
ncbi:hypothetical protein CLU97_4073 [Chryseobacterium sp. 7]|uniref:hypothetical protein n=1 Tax=Chryseobacterium sp. 7 TaxID=2035214 RepID=UPI000EACBFA6|nr:hypothetical protein [Chryseobacterium sp. 7]RLJ34558.1 hypothetical protein CLU97_4073 [Chryseobacterium sp. 7]